MIGIEEYPWINNIYKDMKFTKYIALAALALSDTVRGALMPR